MNNNSTNGMGDKRIPETSPVDSVPPAAQNPANNVGSTPSVPRIQQNQVRSQTGANKMQTPQSVTPRPAQNAQRPNGAPRQGTVRPQLTQTPATDATVAIAPQQKNPAAATDVTKQIAPQQKNPAAATDATKQIAPQQKGVPAEIKKGTNKNGGKKKGGTTEAGNTVMSLLKCMAYITVVLIISVIISVFVILVANDMYGFVKSSDPVEITIPEGADIGELADILYDNNVIKYKWLFKMKNKDVSDFKAGTYTISPNQSYDKIIAEFREKIPTGVSWITIPEGFTTDEIIDLMVENGIGKRERYIEVINNYDFDYWFVDELGDDWADDGRIYRLDGYLFPDTYQFYNASSEETVIKKFLARFNQVFVKSYKERAAELGYTVDEILTLASIIEKEAANQSEFGDVSSVFHNRLNDPANFPRLESDATVVYSIQHITGVRPNLTKEDLESDDPYNSYVVKGLVPGPIANPSNSAILAALNPKKTGYHYFVSNGKETFFANDLAGHEANKAKYPKPSAE